MRPRPLSPQVVVVLRHVEAVLTSGARALDRLPTSPKGCGALLVRADRIRRQKLAAVHSERWVELNRLADTEGVLGLDEFREMLALEASAAPSTRWLDRGHALQRLSLESLMRGLSRTSQRAWRGWSDEDLWSLNQTLCQTLGAQLIALGQQTNGSPLGGDGGFDEWREALDHHGRVLATLGAGGVTDLEDAVNRDECQVAVRRSLLWVVDHLGSLGW